MKIKIILSLTAIILGFLAWHLFVDNFSQEPIEIIINQKEKDLEVENREPVSTEASVSEEKNEEEKLLTENSAKQEKTFSEKEIAFIPKENSFIIDKKVSWGYSISNGRTIDTVIIHSSYDALGSEPYNVNGLIKEYQQYGVAPHFLIDRKGNVYRLIDEKNIAYHAGVSKIPDGRTNVNNFSIGIELMNTEEDDYTKYQYSSLNKLLEYLKSQYNIKYILGHKDISPDRKTDPWNFDWKKIEK